VKIAEAKAITGGLSNPSKMPGKAYNLSAFDCDMGSKLAVKAGSVCSECYARKGRYRFPMVQKALKHRLASLDHPYWIEAMVTLISKQSPKHFRLHDSGDIQSLAHLMAITAICGYTPNTQHWLPTKEYGIIKQYLKHWDFPSNLCVRVSAPLMDHLPKTLSGVLGSMVFSKDKKPDTSICPASKQGNQCGSCRNCWDSSIPVIAYPKH